MGKRRRDDSVVALVPSTFPWGVGIGSLRSEARLPLSTVCGECCLDTGSSDRECAASLQAVQISVMTTVYNLDSE